MDKSVLDAAAEFSLAMMMPGGEGAADTGGGFGGGAFVGGGAGGVIVMSKGWPDPAFWVIVDSSMRVVVLVRVTPSTKVLLRTAEVGC